MENIKFTAFDGMLDGFRNEIAQTVADDLYDELSLPEGYVKCRKVLAAAVLVESYAKAPSLAGVKAMFESEGVLTGACNKAKAADPSNQGLMEAIDLLQNVADEETFDSLRARMV